MSVKTLKPIVCPGIEKTIPIVATTTIIQP